MTLESSVTLTVRRYLMNNLINNTIIKFLILGTQINDVIFYMKNEKKALSKDIIIKYKIAYFKIYNYQ